MQREYNREVVYAKLFKELRNPRWYINFCPNCGAISPDTSVDCLADQETGHLCGLGYSLHCKLCGFQSSYPLFCIEDIESGEDESSGEYAESRELKSSLMIFKKAVLEDLPANWNNRDNFSKRVNVFMTAK